MSVIEELLAKRPETRTVSVPLDPALAQRCVEAESRYQQAKRSSQVAPKDEERARELEEAREASEALRQELEANSAQFVLRSISPVHFEKLKGENRPTEKQRTDSRKAGVDPPEWNPDTFQPALVAAACVKVTTPSGTQEGLSEEDARRI